MPDREKVANGLRHCLPDECTRECPYINDSDCVRSLMQDALVLLKEQEADRKDAEYEYMPMEAIPVTIGNDYRTWLCSACGSKLQYGKELICPKCHRKIDWEGR